MIATGTIAIWVMAPGSFNTLAAIGSPYLHALSFPLAVENFSLTQRLLGFFIDLTPTTLTLLVLYHAIKLCGLYQQLIIFTEENARHLYWMAMSLFAQQLISPLYQALITPVLTWHHPTGERVIAISVSSFNFGFLLLSLGFLLMSLVMREGARLKADNAAII